MLVCYFAKFWEVIDGGGEGREELTEKDVVVGDHHDSRIQVGFCPWVSTPRHGHDHCACHRISQQL